MTWLVLRLLTIFEAFTYDKGDFLSRSWNRGQRHGVEPSQSRQKAGLDLNTVMKVVKVANFRSPLLVSNGQNILKRDFSPSFALKLMLKDADLIEKFGSSLQSPIPALGVVEKNLAAAVALGFGTENASALIKALEKVGVELKGR